MERGFHDLASDLGAALEREFPPMPDKRPATIPAKPLPSEMPRPAPAAGDALQRQADLHRATINRHRSDISRIVSAAQVAKMDLEHRMGILHREIEALTDRTDRAVAIREKLICSSAAALRELEFEPEPRVDIAMVAKKAGDSVVDLSKRKSAKGRL